MTTGNTRSGGAGPGGDARTEDSRRKARRCRRPFPPIADYAFLSNCHTGALSHPTARSTGCACPAFDSASVFGTLLDRGAGTFRFGPFGINVPSARTTCRGRTSLSPRGRRPAGWLWCATRDDGPARGADTSRPTPDLRPTTTPSTCWYDGPSARAAVEIEIVCEPVFDYGRTWRLKQ